MVISGFLKEMHMAFLQTKHRLCLLKTWGFLLISKTRCSTRICPFLRLCSQTTTLLHVNTTGLILWSLSECHRKEYILTFQLLSFSKKECIIPRVYLPRKLTDLFEYLHSFCSKSPSLFLLHFQIRQKKSKVFQWHTNGANNIGPKRVGKKKKSTNACRKKRN